MGFIDNRKNMEKHHQPDLLRPAAPDWFNTLSTSIHVSLICIPPPFTSIINLQLEAEERRQSRDVDGGGEFVSLPPYILFCSDRSCCCFSSAPHNAAADIFGTATKYCFDF